MDTPIIIGMMAFVCLAMFLIRKYKLFGSETGSQEVPLTALGGKRDTNTHYAYGVSEMQGRRMYVADGDYRGRYAGLMGVRDWWVEITHP